MPRKRKHSDEEEEEESEEVENGVRTKRRAALAARDRVIAKEGASDEDEDEEDYDDEDDEKDEDFDGEGAGDEEGDEEGDEDDEGDEDNDEADVEGDEEDEEEEADEEEPDPIECILAELEEPTTDTPGYVLKRKDGPKKLEICFMGELREMLADITEAFTTHFEEKKLPVLQITKYDTIGDTKDTIQLDVLEVKYDKAYDIRDMEEDNDDILSQNFYSMVKVDGIDGIWATQYFLQDD